MEFMVDDPDQTLAQTDPSAARTVIEKAIHHGSLLYPPPELSGIFLEGLERSVGGHFQLDI